MSKKTISIFELSSKNILLWNESSKKLKDDLINILEGEESEFEINLARASVIDGEFCEKVFVPIIKKLNETCNGSKFLIFSNPDNSDVMYVLKRTFENNDLIAIVKHNKTCYLVGKTNFQDRYIFYKVLEKPKISSNELCSLTNDPNKCKNNIDKFINMGYFRNNEDSLTPMFSY